MHSETASSHREQELRTVPTVAEQNVGGRDVYVYAGIGLLTLLAAIILFTFRDYGITWDEPLHRYYGRLIARYYLMLLQGHYDPSAFANEYLNVYGGLFDTVVALVNAVSPLGQYETRHLLNALVGLVGIVACWKIGNFVAGPKAGFLAALFMALTPRYYGAMFNNPKDLPFAVGYVWSLYYLLRIVPHLPKIPAELSVKLGLAIGMTLAIRVGGIIVLCYLGLVMALSALSILFGHGTPREKRQLIQPLIGRLAGISAIAWIIMLVFWPWAQSQPLTRPFEALTTFAKYPWLHSVLFDGAIIKAVDVPRTYIFKWLLITLPEATLAIVAVGIALGILLLLRRGEIFRSTAGILCSLIAFTFVFPLAVALLLRPVLYDAERHFLYIVPPITCFAAIVFTLVSRRLTEWKRVVAISVNCLLAAYLAYQLNVMIRLHPGEYVYFNRTIGGLPGAYGKFDTDYWGNSYREAVLKLVKYVEQNEHPRLAEYKVMSVSKRESSSYYFPPYFQHTKKAEEADFFIATTRDRLNEWVDGDVILTVERFGVPLAIVKDHRRLKGVPARDWPQL